MAKTPKELAYLRIPSMVEKMKDVLKGKNVLFLPVDYGGTFDFDAVE